MNFPQSLRVCLAVAAVFLFGGCQSRRPPAALVGPLLRVATYNVNYGNRPEEVVQTISRIDADVICLQETDNFEIAIRHSLAEKFPHIYFRDSETRAAGGFAFLSKYPAREITWIASEDWFGGWIMGFETPLGAVQILNVHLRPPVKKGSWVKGYFLTRGDRLREVEQFYARREANSPIIVAGDFNDTSGSKAANFLERRGLANALSIFDRRSPTWNWRMGWITLSRRIDHIFSSSDLKCVAASVANMGTSDHLPVTASFQSSLDESE